MPDDIAIHAGQEVLVMGLVMLLPMALAPLLLMLAGLAFMVGAKGVAKALAMAVAVMVFAPVVLGPVLAEIPTWMLIVMVPAFGFAVAGAIVSAFFGRAVWHEMLGHWLARYVGAFWVAGTLLVLLFVLL